MRKKIKKAEPRKAGQIAQEKHIEQIEGLVKNLEKLMSGEFQLQVEPLIPKKIDKKKLN